MDDEQAKKLGRFLRTRREALSLSTRQLAAVAGVPDSTIVRFEQGAYAAPSPDKLARLAEALDLNLADVYSLADYAVPANLPSPGPYLRTKYRDLPPAALAALSHDVARVLARHGITLGGGPVDGEDESPDGPAPARPASRRTKAKKGGSS